MAVALYNQAIIVSSGSRNVKTRWIAIFFSALLITGCGQKGDLYLPGDEPQQSQSAQ